MASLTGTFSAKGNTADLVLRPNESMEVILTKSGSGEFSIVLDDRIGAAYVPLATFTADTAGTTYVNNTRNEKYLRLTCHEVTGGTSVAYSLADVAGDDLSTPVLNAAGEAVFKVTDAGIESDGTVTAANVSLSGNLLTSANVGTAGTGVTAVEHGFAGIHQTVLTLTDVALPIVSVTTGAGVGGVTLYTMPEGYIYTLGCVAALTWAIPTAEQGDFTDATPEGQMGIGTLAPANADALGTDATDDNLATAADITGADFEGAVNLASEAPLAYDGSETAMPIVLTGLIDAGDIDDDATTSINVSGTVTLTYINRGDVTAP